MTSTQTSETYDEGLAIRRHRQLYGPAGWTRDDGTVDLLVPFMDAGRPVLGFSRFSALDDGACARLLATLPRPNLEDRQNLGPSCGAVLRAAVSHPGLVRPHGYLVTPPRWDERVSIDAMIVFDPPRGWQPASRTSVGTDRAGVWRAIRSALTLEAETAEPDELIRVLPEGCGGRLAWWLWWD